MESGKRGHLRRQTGPAARSVRPCRSGNYILEKLHPVPLRERQKDRSLALDGIEQLRSLVHKIRVDVSDVLVANRVVKFRRSSASQCLTSWRHDQKDLRVFSVSDAGGIGGPPTENGENVQNAQLIMVADDEIRQRVQAKASPLMCVPLDVSVPRIRWIPHPLMPADSMMKMHPSAGNDALRHLLRTGKLVWDEETIRQSAGLGRSRGDSPFRRDSEWVVGTRLSLQKGGAGFSDAPGCAQAVLC